MARRPTTPTPMRSAPVLDLPPAQPPAPRPPRWLRGDRLASVQKRVIARGEALWRRGDPAVNFTWIETGLVKIIRGNAEGAETILGLFGPGDSIGDVAVLEHGFYPADAVAASSRVVICQSRAAPILAAAAADPALASSLQEPLLRHTDVLRQTIEVVSAGAVPRRLATLLLGLADRFGRPAAGGDAILVPFHLLRAELAALVAARVETTIRIMSRWQREGIVATGPRGFLLRSAPLRALACSES